MTTPKDKTAGELLAEKEIPDAWIVSDQSIFDRSSERWACAKGFAAGQESKWIPVGERLPDCTEVGEKEQNLVNVLLQWKSGMSKVVIAARVSCWEDDQPLWFWVDENGDDDPFDHELATHWSPFPPLPTSNAL